ncbi:hypothetical protein NL676_013745 [Syzygium grande]|nr:hypothetical protein NL676_013745 [Syzygium grande]
MRLPCSKATKLNFRRHRWPKSTNILRLRSPSPAETNELLRGSVYTPEKPRHFLPSKSTIEYRLESMMRKGHLLRKNCHSRIGPLPSLSTSLDLQLLSRRPVERDRFASRARIPQTIEEFGVLEGVSMKKMDRSGGRQGKGQVRKVGSIMQSLPSQTQVFLNEWWLVNANGKGLAVGGFAHRDSERVSLFCSAPIVKRHDTTTFETADGMTIMIGGLINRLRTLENGFSSKVCNKFLLGFPYDWAEYSTSCYGEDSSVQAGSVKATASEKTDAQSRSTTNYFEATSLDAVTVPKLRDLYSLGDLDDSFLMKKIYDDVVGMLGSGAELEGEYLRSSRKSDPKCKCDGPSNSSKVQELLRGILRKTTRGALFMKMQKEWHMERRRSGFGGKGKCQSLGRAQDPGILDAVGEVEEGNLKNFFVPALKT